MSQVRNRRKRLCTEVWGRFSYAGHRNLCGNLVKFERFSLLIRRGDLTRQEVSVFIIFYEVVVSLKIIPTFALAN